ncbi:hypothetical protein PHLH4_51740 [Pseudomonas sp. St316]|nr:hypothetical protein PHLH4_51740 [Pseudomonas sp. St316]
MDVEPLGMVSNDLRVTKGLSPSTPMITKSVANEQCGDSFTDFMSAFPYPADAPACFCRMYAICATHGNVTLYASLAARCTPAAPASATPTGPNNPVATRPATVVTPTEKAPSANKAPMPLTPIKPALAAPSPPPRIAASIAASPISIAPLASWNFREKSARSCALIFSQTLVTSFSKTFNSSASTDSFPVTLPPTYFRTSRTISAYGTPVRRIKLAMLFPPKSWSSRISSNSVSREYLFFCFAATSALRTSAAIARRPSPESVRKSTSEPTSAASAT